MEADLRLLVLRQKFLTDTTIGNMFLMKDKYKTEYFGYTLEDAVRPWNIKIHGETSIPEGEYEINIRWSPKFSRNVIWIRHVPNFDFIYIHALNTNDETLGCIGIAQNYDGKKTIQGSLEKKLFSVVEGYLANGKRVILDIRNIGNV
jgi:hypothetical protein